MIALSQNRVAHERKTMRVHRRAFMRALRETPDPKGEADHLLEALDKLLASQDAYSDLALAIRDVTLFERNHDDMTVFATEMSLSGGQMDDLFRAAMRIENAGGGQALPSRL